MAIAVMIIRVLLAIPSLINLFKEIMEIIDGQKGGEKIALTRDLARVLNKHLKTQCSDPGACERDLQGFKEHLAKKYV